MTAGGGGSRKTHPPELRHDPLSGRWVLIAPDRARRPNDYRNGRPAWAAGPRASCPFCPGREAETPAEVDALRGQTSVPDSPGWRIRVVPNKYPALVPGPGPSPGRHEVVIDSPDHEREWADLPDDHLRDLLETFRRRLRVLENDPAVRYVQIFKNKGASAGASLRHPHTQILAVPEVPRQIRDEMENLERTAAAEGEGCPVCRLIEREADGPRLIQLNRDFAALAPYASRFPYEIHVWPRRHAASFRETGEAELLILARMLKDLLGRLRAAAGDPDYHLLLRQGPSAGSGAESRAGRRGFIHWRLEILPILAAVAGFEWGTGCFINPVLPESAAAALRG